ncbi:MAG: methyltransferase [Bacteroidales bacterium]|nr:methyltransferase [Bacteroidales bacterium]
MSRFHFKHFSLCHDRSTMKVGTDAVLLGAWVEVKPSDWVLDIGTGCGVLPLMLAQKGIAKVHAVDLDEASALEAAENFQASQWSRQLFAFHADIRKFTMQCAYDLIISNPPFFINSFKCDADRRNQARHTDTSLTFNDLITSVRRLLKPEGRFALVLPERESHDFIPLAEQANLFLFRKENIIPIEGKTPNRVNLELRYGKPETVLVSNLIIRHEDGSFTDNYQERVRDFYLG